MANPNVSNINFFAFPRNDWSRILAYAWQPENSTVLNDLRKDPKGTIMELAKGTNGKYQDVDDVTKGSAKSIQEQAEGAVGEGYSGYLPIPDPLEELAGLTPKALEVLLQNGITGILQFDRQAKTWADVLPLAWKDKDKLREIRKDPLKHLPPELLEDEKNHGIFPLPDRPRGLERLTIEELGDFLSDEDNASHLSGIFLIGS